MQGKGVAKKRTKRKRVFWSVTTERASRTVHPGVANFLKPSLGRPFHPKRNFSRFYVLSIARSGICEATGLSSSAVFADAISIASISHHFPTTTDHETAQGHARTPPRVDTSPRVHDRKIRRPALELSIAYPVSMECSVELRCHDNVTFHEAVCGKQSRRPTFIGSLQTRF
ncbi:hypothetical protein GEV33_008890 [Tenebrio molitor]|uniref:Uncharacterized protein n=1 Tax=Tenebrio molitor TaxID=7067 RepID=A0A8J6HFV2_TENMO|nr:hypothetical protein GEV33_008890 [Tenebrio molitor]